MTSQQKKQILDCTDFEQLLNTEYGKRGTTKREAFEADAEAFCLGECLKENRLKAGLTQQQLATQLGMRTNTISRLEHGHSDVSLASIFQIFAGMGKRVAFSVL